MVVLISPDLLSYINISLSYKSQIVGITPRTIHELDGSDKRVLVQCGVVYFDELGNFLVEYIVIYQVIAFLQVFVCD